MPSASQPPPRPLQRTSHSSKIGPVLAEISLHLGQLVDQEQAVTLSIVLCQKGRGSGQRPEHHTEEDSGMD